MDIEFNLGGNTLKIPGVNGSYFPPVSWNPYDCPVGYFNLEETPKIKKTTSYEKYKFHDADGGSMGMKDGKIAFIYNLLNFPTLNALGNHPPVNGYLGKFVKYQFNDDNVLSFHQIPGLELVDVHFALVCKLTGTGGEKFDITDEYIPCKFWDLYGKEYHVPVVNPIYEGLDMGQYKLYKFDEDNDGIYFGTPELPMNKLKDVVIEVPEKSEIMLRVIAKFSSDKYNDPIMFQANYKMDVQEENAQKDRLFFSMEQQNFHWDYFTHDLMVKINMSTSSQYEAHEIVMEPGFVGTNGYVATSVNMSYPTKGNTVSHTYSFTCSNNLKSAIANDVDSNVDSEFNKNRDIKVYPNPSNGFVYISSTELDDEIIKIELYNNIGALVYVNEDIETSEFELNLSDYNSGLYFMKVLMNNNINYSKKIILK